MVVHEMQSRRDFMKLASAAVTAAAAMGPNQLRAATINRSDEAMALVQFIEQTHPRGAQARSDPEWGSLTKAYVRQAQASRFEHFAIESARILRWFRDGHTTLSISSLDADGFGPRLPFQSSAFFDGFHIYRAGPEALPLLGKRVTRVGNLAADEFARRFIDIWPGNNLANAHNDLRSALELPGFLFGLGAIEDRDSPIRIEGIDSEGRSAHVDFAVPQERTIDMQTVDRPLTPREEWAQQAGSGNYVHVDDQVLYISLDSLRVERSEFEPFVREAIAAIEQSEAERLILDLRRNYGGNNYFGEPLRKAIAKSGFNRAGGIYVLIAPTTFSAAQNLATRLERETYSIFAGEPTGGSPNHYGDSAGFPDEVQSISGGVSTLPWFDSYPQDTRLWIMPDLLTPRTFGEWSSGRDETYNAARTHQAEAETDPLDLDRILYFSRPSQSQDWRPFWQLTQ
jgi:hypothetical protein